MTDEEFDLNYYNQLCAKYGRLSLEVQSYLDAHKDHPDAQAAQAFTNMFLELARKQPGALEKLDGSDK